MTFCTSITAWVMIDFCPVIMKIQSRRRGTSKRIPRRRENKLRFGICLSSLQFLGWMKLVLLLIETCELHLQASEHKKTQREDIELAAQHAGDQRQCTILMPIFLIPLNDCWQSELLSALTPQINTRLQPLKAEHAPLGVGSCGCPVHVRYASNGK